MSIGPFSLSGSGGVPAGWLLAVLGIAAGRLAAARPFRPVLPVLVGAAWVAIVVASGWALALAVVPALKLELGRTGCALVGAVLTAAVGMALGFIRRAPVSADRIWRGTLILPGRGHRLARRPAQAHRLQLAGLPLPPADEAKHFKLIGTTGTGKSTAIRGLLAGAMERGDRVVIADPDGGYLDRFHDAGRGDVVLSPFDARAPQWDLFGELHSVYDSDQLARALIADQPGDERTWRSYARVFLASLLRQLQAAGEREVATLHRLVVAAPEAELALLLDGTAAGPYLAGDNARFFASVRAIAATHLAVLEHVARQHQAARFSVRNFVRELNGGPRPGVLFLPYRAGQIATVRGLVSAWMRLAIFETMELGEEDHRIWFVVDELDALGAIDGLKDALARLRKFGGRCVLGFQSIAQVTGTYGAQDAQTIVENCGNTLILRCSASDNGGTARFASRLIGEREVLREHVTRSQPTLFGNAPRSRTRSIQHVTEAAVLPAEIEQLPDFAGYVKFASNAAWHRVDGLGA